MKDATEYLNKYGRDALRESLKKNQKEATPDPKPSSPKPKSNTTIPKATMKKDGLPPIRSLRALVDDIRPLPDELVAGLLHRGSTMVFGGGSKTNKTFCLMDLALSVAAGIPWWDLKTTKGRVLYLDYELDSRFFTARARKIADAKGIGSQVLDDVDVWNLRGFAADITEQVPKIVEKIKDRNYAMIVIDPIYKALGKRDENAAGDINSLMNEIETLAVQSGAAVIIGHHFSKGNQAGKNSMDRISGSGVFGRAPDAIVIITTHEQENTYTVETTLRNFKRMEPFCIEWAFPLMERNESLDPNKLKKPGAATTQYTVHQLLKVLGVQKLTTKEWEEQTCKDTGMKPRTFANKKKELVDGKKVTTVDKDKWKAVSPIYPPGWNSVRQEQAEEVQAA
jgi:AAA domain